MWPREWVGVWTSECVAWIKKRSGPPCQNWVWKGSQGPFSAKFGLLLCLYTSICVKIGQNAVKTGSKCAKLENASGRIGLRCHLPASKWVKIGAKGVKRAFSEPLKALRSPFWPISRLFEPFYGQFWGYLHFFTFFMPKNDLFSIFGPPLFSGWRPEKKSAFH